jgi:7-carboxy-7-deazaguanine synthase
MFGKNEIYGAKNFADAPVDSLKVTSIFYTLQGEGPFTGRPAMFIRLAHCNLNCSFCDAYFDAGEFMTFDEIEQAFAREIAGFFDEVPGWALGYRDMVLVITGGEPMIQKNLVPFIKYMSSRFAKIQIGSNGTQLLDIPSSTVLVVSPKCSEKTQKYLSPKPEVLARANALKFVVTADETSPYHKIPDWADEWQWSKRKSVYVSPMNMYNKEPRESKIETYFGDLKDRSTIDERISFWTPGLLDNEKNQLNHEYAAEYAMRHNYILNLQTHLYASLP